MSLLNQVLRNLDQRQAASSSVSVSTAARPALPSAGQRVTRWAVGLGLTLVAVVIGGWAQGTLRWPSSSAPAATAVAALPAAAPTMASASAAQGATQLTQERVERAPESAPSPKPGPALAGKKPSPPPVAQVSMAPPAPRAAAGPRPSQPTATAAHSNSATGARIEMQTTARTPQERAEALYQRGITAHQSGQLADAAIAFAAALREEPRFHPARLALSGHYIAQSRTDDAQALIQEGLALAPAQTQLVMTLARLQADRGDLQAALGTLESGSAQSAQNAEFQGVHAAVLQRVGRHADAAEKFSAALRLAPGHSIWWMGLGMSLAAHGQADAAREAFTRAKMTGRLSPEAAQYVDTRLKQLL